MTNQAQMMAHFDALTRLQKTVYGIIQRHRAISGNQIIEKKYGPFPASLTQRVEIRLAIKELVRLGFAIELIHEGRCAHDDCDAYVEHAADRYVVSDKMIG